MQPMSTKPDLSIELEERNSHCFLAFLFNETVFLMLFNRKKEYCNHTFTLISESISSPTKYIDINLKLWLETDHMYYTKGGGLGKF